jgi:hypothetical protein
MDRQCVVGMVQVAGRGSITSLASCGECLLHLFAGALCDGFGWCSIVCALSLACHNPQWLLWRVCLLGVWQRCWQWAGVQVRLLPLHIG